MTDHANTSDSRRVEMPPVAPRGTIDSTNADSPPLAEGRARPEKEVLDMPPHAPATQRSPLLDRCLNRAEAAAYVGLGTRKFGDEVRAGRIPHYAIARRYLFDPADLDVYVLAHRNDGGAER